MNWLNKISKAAVVSVLQQVVRPAVNYRFHLVRDSQGWEEHINTDFYWKLRHKDWLCKKYIRP